MTATLGLVGVLVGAFLSQGLSALWQRRKERLEALVELVSANARVISAHERLYDLFAAGASPALNSDQVRQTLAERSEAHAQWRTSHARVEILIPDDEPLQAAIDDFGRGRASATVWIREYQSLGTAFSLADHAAAQEKAWLEMRHARYSLIAAGQAIASRDARWLPLKRKRAAPPTYRKLDSANERERLRALDG